MSPSGHLAAIEARGGGPHSVEMHTVTAVLLLTARFYSIADLPSRDRLAATQVAGNILHAAGIDMMWMDCTDRPSPHQRATTGTCLTPPRADEVIVRAVSAPSSTRPALRASGETLGDAYVDTAAATGSLATIYVDRVAVLARAAGVDRATLLGRVMAHEIGHLLLGTTTHRDFGLMRAEWSTALIQRRMANDWRLSTRDAASAREGVLKRTRSVPATDVSAPATLPCASARGESAPATCPSCPVCATLLPADRVAFDLFIEPRFERREIVENR